MADRIARVVLQAVVTQYRDAMKGAAKDTEDLGKKSKVTATQTQQSMQTLGRGMMVGGAVVVAGFGAAVMASARFEKQMSGVKAVSSATAGEMKKLSDAALKAGADTVFSASDAAKAEAELAKAGIAVSDILGGALTGSLSLAAAGQLDLAEAATISAQAMNIFKLQGSDVSHIADVLAAGANKSAADVGQLGDALRQGGLVAAQTGLSLEDTTGALAAFADNALVGSDAGTALKTMLQRLTPQSKEAAALMDELGITAYDAEGNFVGLEQYAGKLRAGLSGLTAEQKNTALATIFGSDAVRAAAVLYDQGAAGIADYTAAVNDQGAAARMAATQMDNLSGDVEALKGSLETALIQGGSGANAVLREITQAATGAVNAFGQLPGPVQAGATGLVGLTGAAVLAGGAVMVGVGQVTKFRGAMETLGVASQRTDRMLRGVGMATKTIGAAGAVLAISEIIGALNSAGADAAPSMDRLSEGLVDFVQTGQASGQLAATLGSDFSDLGEKIETASLRMHSWSDGSGSRFRLGGPGGRDIKEARQDIEALDQSLAAMVGSGHADIAAEAFHRLSQAATDQGVSAEEVNRAFSGYQNALAGSRAESKATTGATGGLTAEIDKQAKASLDAAKSLRDQASAAQALFDPIFAAQDALAKHAEAQTAVNKALREHGRNSAEYKQAQTDVLRATVDVHGALGNLKAGLQDGSVSLSNVNSQLGAYTQAGLISAAQARRFKAELAGVAGQSDALASKLGLLGQVDAKPSVDLDGFNPALNSLRVMEAHLAELDGRRVRVNVAVVTYQTSLHAAERQLGIGSGHAEGGPIAGPGTGTSDSILARLSNGEYVIRASAARRHRALLDTINNAPGFAAGGPVGFNPNKGSLAHQANVLVAHGGSADEIRALSAAYDEYLRKLDQAAERTRLLRDIQQAKSKAERASAREALRDLDRAAAREKQRAAADRAAARAETAADRKEVQKARADHTAELQDNMFELGAISAKQQQKNLTARMAKLEKYSDEWTALFQQRAQIVAQQHQTALGRVTFTAPVTQAQMQPASIASGRNGAVTVNGGITLQGSRATPQELRRELAWLTR
jgi:TP901 family phage tail tape measure protein